MGWAWKLQSKPLWIHPERRNLSFSRELKGLSLIVVFMLLGDVYFCDRKVWMYAWAFLWIQRTVCFNKHTVFGEECDWHRVFCNPQWRGDKLFQKYVIGTLRKRRISTTRVFLVHLSPPFRVEIGSWGCRLHVANYSLQCRPLPVLKIR